MTRFAGIVRPRKLRIRGVTPEELSHEDSRVPVLGTPIDLLVSEATVVTDVLGHQLVGVQTHFSQSVQDRLLLRKL
jgi:hypothetical protein